MTTFCPCVCESVRTEEPQGTRSDGADGGECWRSLLSVCLSVYLYHFLSVPLFTCRLPYFLVFSHCLSVFSISRVSSCLSADAHGGAVFRLPADQGDSGVSETPTCGRTSSLCLLSEPPGVSPASPGTKCTPPAGTPQGCWASPSQWRPRPPSSGESSFSCCPSCSCSSSHSLCPPARSSWS